MTKSILIVIAFFTFTISAQEKSKQIETIIVEKDKNLGPDDVYVIVDTPAEFPGGFKFMREYISSKLKNMDSAFSVCQDRLTGTIFVNFVIEKNGTISNVKLLKGLNGCTSCNEAAIKIIQEMPSWSPAKNENKIVRSSYNLPFRFEPQK